MKKKKEIGGHVTTNVPIIFRKKKEYRILEKHCEVKFEIGANISEGRAT